jgi:hypothetical protein
LPDAAARAGDDRDLSREPARHRAMGPGRRRRRGRTPGSCRAARRASCGAGR